MEKSNKYHGGTSVNPTDTRIDARKISQKPRQKPSENGVSSGFWRLPRIFLSQFKCIGVGFTKALVDIYLELICHKCRFECRDCWAVEP